MHENSFSEIPVVEAQTRFLYPFRYSVNDTVALCKKLLGLTWNNASVWRADSIPAYYATEYLPGFAQCYFGSSSEVGPTYLTVNPQCQAQWSGKAFRVIYSPSPAIQYLGWGSNASLDFGRRHEAGDGRQKAKPIPPIELFLAPHGVGVLSITVAPLALPKTYTIQHLKQLNNKLAQFQPVKAALLVGMNDARAKSQPLDRKYGEAIRVAIKEGIRQFPKTILGRLESSQSETVAAWFTLTELADWLLTPLGLTGDDRFGAVRPLATPTSCFPGISMT